MQKLNKKILITGGAGYIGQNLISFFIKKNYQLHVVDNLTTSLPINKDVLKKIKFYKIDFKFSNIVSPLESLQSPDARKLGLLIKSIILKKT